MKFTYHLDGKVATRTAQKASGETANVITYDYDTTFRRLSAERVTTPGTGVDQAILSISRTYDSLGRAEFVTSHNSATPDTSTFADAVNQVQYTYNAFGALDKEYQEHEGKVDGSSLHVDYAYDDATGSSYRGLSSVFTKGMRPKSIEYPNGRLVHYTYGTGGGHTATMRTATSSRRSTGILPVSRRAVPALPWLGKPTGGTPVTLMGKMPMGLMGETPMLRFDARGNPLGGSSGMSAAPKPSAMTATYACIYDAWNRLVEVYVDADVDGVIDPGESVATYRYDGTGRRIRKYVPDGEDWTVSEFYYNAGWQLLETRKAEEVTRTGSPTLAEPAAVTAVYEQYVWSQRYIDAPILRDENKNSDGDCTDAEDERLYYCTDAGCNVTALVTAAGTVVERYAYDPYGQPIFYDGSWATQTSSSHGNAILYGGYYYDVETGFYHVRNRMYHAQLGRWLQRDPLGYVDGMSLYEYCGNSPALCLDPMGLTITVQPPNWFSEHYREERQVYDTVNRTLNELLAVDMDVERTQARNRELSEDERKRHASALVVAALVQYMSKTKDIDIVITTQWDPSLQENNLGATVGSDGVNSVPGNVALGKQVRVWLNPESLGDVLGKPRKTKDRAPCVLIHELVHCLYGIAVVKTEKIKPDSNGSTWPPADLQILIDTLLGKEYPGPTIRLVGVDPRDSQKAMDDAREAGTAPKKGDKLKLSILDWSLTGGYEDVVEKIVDERAVPYFSPVRQGQGLPR